MAKTRGAQGPLTLSCRKCKRHLVGNERPFVRTGETKTGSVKQYRYGTRRELTEVECVCGHRFFTNHDSVKYIDIKRF